MKYGTRASSGGSRASARDHRPRGRRRRKKWLRRVRTSIVCWVSSIGTVDMPELLNDPKRPSTLEGRGHHRLHPHPAGPAKWTKVDARQNARNDKAYDAEFVKARTTSPRPPTWTRRRSCTTARGDVVPAPENLDAWLTDDLIPCAAHPPSACAMSTVASPARQDQAVLAHAMMSIPAQGLRDRLGLLGTSKRGSGTTTPSARARTPSARKLGVTKNDAGGVLGGITSGADIYFRVAIKPVSTIGRAQPPSATTAGRAGGQGRHDPCVLPRVVPLVEAMSALAIADAALIQLGREGSMQDSRQKKRKLQWPTIPQLYVKGEFVGGCDIITDSRASPASWTELLAEFKEA
ncbi:Chorismate synthase [Phytophthora cinnamomi]|uniref:Chorismate synthase n=1 Tax=Phytophthora cinnamomi TaxID=4785 RepID=UPI0035593C02|nr:Chorismate synthase [Phytophthora cinnamomi]